MRVGIGNDIHRLVPDRALMIGGVGIPSETGSAGHSDGDALLHAVIDAMLGAAGLGDIGRHFPSSEARWKDADSGALLRLVTQRLDAEGWRVENVDCTVVLERPRLAPYTDQIRARVAALLSTGAERVNVKAKTNEGLDAVGTGRAIAAHAAVLLERKQQHQA